MTLTAPLSTLHTVTFECVSIPGPYAPMYRGKCTCGWLMRGAKAAVYNSAAVHDLEQWPLTDDDLHTTL